MAGSSKPRNATPANSVPSLKKSNSSSRNQTSIAGFFKKKTAEDSPSRTPKINGSTTPINSLPKKSDANNSSKGSNQSLTPAPSSDAIDEINYEDSELVKSNGSDGPNGLPSPITPAGGVESAHRADENGVSASFYSPSRKAKKAVNYAVDMDSEDEDEEDAFKPTKVDRGQKRASKRRKTIVESDDDDVFVGASEAEFALVDEDDFVVDDDSEVEMGNKKKRKRSSKASPITPKDTNPEYLPMVDDAEIGVPSTAQQWSYNPENLGPLLLKQKSTAKTSSSKNPAKAKAHTTEPDQRYPWLASVEDMDRKKPDDPGYDPRTVYIPPYAWKKFSPFEKQYWEIKQKFWDTIVFFKKGKFYELYENDATVGHQLFDLKLTDRVNMRMVGVPEATLHTWATQFVAKGYKVARVDQIESALGKEMREREDMQSGDKVIRRELASVLTGGTLVEGGMLQDDMSTYCVSIKESEQDGQPAFGIAFVDTATAQFSLTDFVDDTDLTKFETFIAQIKPQEILLEKSRVSAKALRILKNSTGPTTIWNHLKPGKEFWTADITCREIDAGKYFVSDEEADSEAWPRVLKEAREKEVLMSAFGALVQYLRTLQIERELLTLRSVSWYDPIRNASSLVLDGKSLFNLEVFANSFDGGSEGTLFSLLNRCITPFGKRMFKQWVCHPLIDVTKINARLDAVEGLNADRTVRERFTDQLQKLPDLERIVSRIHAGSCKAQEFANVLDGFEQIDYTVRLLKDFGSGDGIIGQLIAKMPDRMRDILEQWKSAFDRSKAKADGILIPERGVESDFDASQDRIEEILADLEIHLKKVRQDLRSNSVIYRDIGKEIYQLEVSSSVKVPKNWDQKSATQKLKRYYSPELRGENGLIRQLQEARETHGQIVKEMRGRFYQRFDTEYDTWITAVRIVAHLDCLISLAKASSALGEPACRPEFVDEARSVVEFDDLRHPCMLSNVTDFVPNDVKLGGNTANINLLTGANAAGKSTILRMTCIAVIMAQIGCFVPAASARLTPVDRIMSRLGANDNIFAAQSTFFVELAETKKILAEATPRSLVILDELGRGTSSYDGVAVAQAVLHHVATHIGCVGFFATHYHSLAEEFATHPEIRNRRMQIDVDDTNRRVTFLYKLEDGVAEGSFGMHCASMCGIPSKVVERAEVAAREWEHTSKLKESLELARQGCWVPLGVQSDVASLLKCGSEESSCVRGLDVLKRAIEEL